MGMPVFACVAVLLAAPQLAFAEKGDYVVLLHGIGRTSNTMRLVEHVFEKDGYQVLNIDYPSREYTIENLVRKIQPQIESFVKDKKKKIHFIGYSLGGLVVRAYVAKHRPARMGRVVMMGTPNGGSEVADTFKDYALFQAFYGPAGQELTTANGNAKIFGREADYEVGTIAGTRSIDPVSSFIIPGADDGKVSVKSSHLKGEKAHLTLPVTHTFMPLDGDVVKAARHFIAHGVFPPEMN
jgi:pimeloyl-ACP methyl ester carboxylesterase